MMMITGQKPIKHSKLGQFQIIDVVDMMRPMTKYTKQLERQSCWQCVGFDKVRAAIQSHVAEGADDARFPIYPQRLVADVRAVMPADAIIALDNGVYKIWCARSYPALQPNTVLPDNALATMGAGLPSAMVAKILHADRRLMAICGDGGF